MFYKILCIIISECIDARMKIKVKGSGYGDKNNEHNYSSQINKI